jgi:glycosyltransferase involved in cell wall biosynthesis
MTQKKLKILCVIPNMGSGGAEKVMLTLLEFLNRDRFEPVLVLFEANGAYFDSIPESIRVITLGKESRYSALSLVKKLSRLFIDESPDIILSFLWYANVISIMAKRSSDTSAPLIVGVHNIMSMSLKGQRFERVKRFLISKAYPRADLVLILSNTMREDMATNFKIPVPLMRIVHNPMDIERIEALSLEEPDHPWFSENIPVVISVGRLHRQKNYPTLLKAFAKLREEGDFRLIILGEGPERGALMKLIKELQIEDAVQMPGFVKNPYACLNRSSLFVMSSTHEGLPVAMIEAMACSVPVVASACPSVAEMITDGVNGLLAPVSDHLALSNAMLKVLREDELGGRLAEKNRKEGEKYSVQKIVDDYESIFLNIVKSR